MPAPASDQSGQKGIYSVGGVAKYSAGILSKPVILLRTEYKVNCQVIKPAVASSGGAGTSDMKFSTSLMYA